MHLIIDGDILLYKVGFSIESDRKYIVYPTLEGSVPVSCDSFAEAKKLMKALNHQATIEAEAVLEPFSFAAHTYKSMIQRICKVVIPDKVSIIISGPSSGNPRYEIAKTRPYKGNRNAVERPIIYDQLKAWVTQHLDPIVAPGEADDLIGEMASNDPENTIVASIDKDLLMIPGYNFNIDTQSIVQVEDPGQLHMLTSSSDKKALKGYGFKWFAAQMFLGDTVDNIQGLKGYGPVKTLTTLDKCTTIRDIWAKVIRTYRKEKQLHRLDENRKLLWISRNQPFERYLEK